MLGYDTLMNHYQTNFSLMQHHKYSLSDIENMMPWEKFIYIDMLKKYIKEEQDRIRDQAAMKKAQVNLQKKR
jgi:3-methyladenine DNA glycosylase AlkD